MEKLNPMDRQTAALFEAQERAEIAEAGTTKCRHDKETSKKMHSIDNSSGALPQDHISKHLKVRNSSLCLCNEHTVRKYKKQSLSVNKGASGAEKMTSLCRRACAFYPLLKPFRRPRWLAGSTLGQSQRNAKSCGEYRAAGIQGGEGERSEVVIVAGIQTEGNHKREGEECRDGIGGGGGRILVPKEHNNWYW